MRTRTVVCVLLALCAGGAVALLGQAWALAADQAAEAAEVDVKGVEGQTEGEAPRPEPADAAQPADPFKSKIERVSYCIGVQIGRNMKAGGIQVDAAAFAKGVAQALADEKLLLTEDQMRATMTAFGKEQFALRAAKNKAEGEKFLNENKQREGVVTRPSGLQYEVLREGDGPSPKATDIVETHYRGTLLDGTEFDSSYRRGKPQKFPANRVIRGWTEALQLMKVGAKWKLYVPSDLAYGPPGFGQRIGPNATLVFEMELLGIEEAPKPATPKPVRPEKPEATD